MDEKCASGAMDLQECEPTPPVMASAATQSFQTGHPQDCFRGDFADPATAPFPSDLVPVSCQNTGPDHLSTHSGQIFSIWTKNNHLCIIASKQHYIMNAVIPEYDEDKERPDCLRRQYLQKSDG